MIGEITTDDFKMMILKPESNFIDYFAANLLYLINLTISKLCISILYIHYFTLCIGK